MAKPWFLWRSRSFTTRDQCTLRRDLRSIVFKLRRHAPLLRC